MSATLLLLLGGPALQEAVPTPGDPPATTAPTIDEPAPASSNAEPRRVYIVIDRFREVGGVVLSEDDASITIRREGRSETFERNKVLAIVPLLEIAPDGETGIPGLHLIGTDQGYLGVVGAMVSGVAMANRHALVPVA